MSSGISLKTRQILSLKRHNLYVENFVALANNSDKILDEVSHSGQAKNSI